MNAVGRLLLPLAAALLLAACAGNRPRTAPAPADGAPVAAAPATPPTPPDVPPPHADQARTAPATASAAAAAADMPAPPSPSTVAPTANESPAQTEDDYAALYGTPATGNATANGTYDPWERYNRGVHRFNLGVDRYIAHPLATAYTKVVPGPVRRRVTSFFENLGNPVTMLNQLLQGRPGDAWVTLGRFLLNSTVGLAGLFDPATHAGIPAASEDFGQTLGVWGWRRSRYFELPFLGPRTVRDVFGMAGDYPLSPTRQIEMDKVRYGVWGLRMVDTRARLLPLDEIRADAPDEYALVRDSWMQRRDYQIRHDPERGRHGDRPGEAADLPDYLKQQDDAVRPNTIQIP